MIRRRFLAVAPCWFLANAALADSSDPRFPAKISSKIGGKPLNLVLTGSALRKKYGFSVYTVASYVQQGVKIRDASDLAKADVAKQLQTDLRAGRSHGQSPWPRRFEARSGRTIRPRRSRASC